MVFEDIPESSQDQEAIHFDASQTAQMRQVRDEIATQMWNDYSSSRAPNGTMNLLSTIDKSGTPTRGFATLPQYIGGYGSIFNKEEVVIRFVKLMTTVSFSNSVLIFM
ncbi:Uncharacterized protein Fot_02340 [Forsythia ovata]|uniref:Uncharacterized protein n=1 Tax=Forsythia ovata TaxID=205694 RepID=A0ABD1X748_9LAMI